MKLIKNSQKQIKQKLDRLTETFFQIYDKKYKNKFGKSNVDPDENISIIRSKLKEKENNVASYPNYINKLEKIISLGEEWLERYWTEPRGFEEFSARTRHIIIGTCVVLVNHLQKYMIICMTG